MFRHLVLQKPFAVVDLETTGIDPKTARIVEISVLKVVPPDEKLHRTRRINPGIPIPPQATAIHGITDADVAAEPSFAKLAVGLATLLDGCDLCGYNFKRYDRLVLAAEFERAGVPFSLEGRSIIDPMEIFHAFERRDLAAAVKLYLAREHNGAHSAAGDVSATAEVLDAMLERYRDLPRQVAQLHERFTDPTAIDSSRKLRKIDGKIQLAFGKHSGKTLEQVMADSPGYLDWMLTSDFEEDTKAALRAFLAKGKGIAPPAPRPPTA